MLQALKSYKKVFAEDYREMAVEFKAFVKPRKVKNPTDLLLLILMYSGADKA